VRETSWALVLNLHQPSGNVERLLGAQEWEAKEILWALDRIPRSLWGYEDVGRVHLSLSGTLLETLSDPQFQRRVYGVVDCGSLLWHLQNTSVIDLLGTAYYHPVLPLIAPADRDDQLDRWRGLAGHLFNRTNFGGFWPPEMGFRMELIPQLKRLGYRYVLVDSEYVRPVGPMRWEEIRYRPHIASFGGERIVVVVRDRDLSNAQESGMDIDWFRAEVAARTRHCDFPPLVTTCTDGDNGGWFRNTGPNFWSQFYRPLLDAVRRGDSGGLRPSFIHDYLDRYGVHAEVTVDPGAWNTGWHDGRGFVQWTGSQAQRSMLARVEGLSQAVRAARHDTLGAGTAAEVDRLLEEARWRVLRAETSCNFFWGEAWLPHCENDLDEAARCLDLAGQAFR
jgi:alpha-amylase/alpha-mannosidase (GH57 family)